MKFNAEIYEKLHFYPRDERRQCLEGTVLKGKITERSIGVWCC